eukprot:13970422-Heterocapsa_arctica.AAC.1
MAFLRELDQLPSQVQDLDARQVGHVELVVGLEEMHGTAQHHVLVQRPIAVANPTLHAPPLVVLQPWVARVSQLSMRGEGHSLPRDRP